MCSRNEPGASDEEGRPFAPAREVSVLHSSIEHADEFAIVPTALLPDTHEIETAAPALEVVVIWGDKNVLLVEHMSPPRDFFVGEGERAAFTIGADVLGCPRLPVVVVRDGTSYCVIPEGARVTLDKAGAVHRADDLRANGQLLRSAALDGAEELALASDATARIEHRGFTFVVKGVAAGRKVAGSIGDTVKPLAGLGLYTAFAGLFAIVFMVVLYFSPPLGAGLSTDLLNERSRLVTFSTDASSFVDEEEPLFEEPASEPDGGEGERHALEEGQAGAEESPVTNNRFALRGPRDNEDIQMANAEAREQAASAGILGVLANMNGAFNQPTSPFGAEQALGADPMAALGAIMGDQAGMNFGFRGLGMAGTGRGAGGNGLGTMGLGDRGLRTIGHGAGCTGENCDGNGYGHGAGTYTGGPEERVPRIRHVAADVQGSLSKETIRRVVQRHLNEVRFCYEQELRQQPDLAGRVTVSFIISTSGSVQSATVAQSTVGSQRVDSCIAGAVRRWSFPSPEGGIVVVNYPFTLEQVGQ
jgi:TonB family protein